MDSTTYRARIADKLLAEKLVYHYRDKSGLEYDAVMHLRGGCYG